MSLEEKMIKTYWHDGLLDLLLGLGLVVVGIAWQFDMVALSSVAAALVPLWKPLRQKLVEPRLGHVVFTQAREKRERSFLSSMAVLGLVFLAAGVFAYVSFETGGALPMHWVPGLPAVLLAIPVVAVGPLIKSHRFLIYGAVLALSGVGAVVWGLKPGAAFLASGAVILVVAVWLMVRFFRETKAAAASAVIGEKPGV